MNDMQLSTDWGPEPRTVKIHGTPGFAGMRKAGKLAADANVRIEAINVVEVPVELPLEARMPREERDETGAGMVCPGADPANAAGSHGERGLAPEERGGIRRGRRDQRGSWGGPGCREGPRRTCVPTAGEGGIGGRIAEHEAGALTIGLLWPRGRIAIGESSQHGPIRAAQRQLLAAVG